MPIKNTNNSYGTVAKIFHWLLFILLLGAVIGGNIDAGLPDGAEKTEMLNLHKSMGVLILLLVILRLGWRLINPLPHQLVTGWQLSASIWTHRLLYLLMLAQPMSGCLMSQAAGKPIIFFGLFELPTLLSKNKAWAGVFHEAHEIIWILLAVFALGHMLAALYHHFVVKDDVLRRMGFGSAAAE
jgi:cytochrome b561